MKIAMLSPPRFWSVFLLQNTLAKYLEKEGHIVDIIMSREIVEELKEYDRIFASIKCQKTYDNDLFKNELNQKTWIWAGGDAIHSRIDDWRLFDNVIAQSEFIENELPSYANTKVLHAGIDSDVFDKDDGIEREAEVGIVGNPNAKKKRIGLAKEITDTLEYVFHGGWLKDEDDFKKPEEMADFYNTFNTLLTLATFEGGCMPLIEAGACGCQLVSTPTGYAPEIKNCEVVPFDAEPDEIRETIMDNEKDPYDEIMENWTWNTLIYDWIDEMELVS